MDNGQNAGNSEITEAESSAFGVSHVAPNIGQSAMKAAENPSMVQNLAFAFPEKLTGDERNGRVLASFVLRLLRNFETSYRYGIDRLGIRPRCRGNLKRSVTSSGTANSMLQIPQISSRDRDRALLRLVFNICIENSRELLCDALDIPDILEDRVKEAFEGQGQSAKVTNAGAVRALETIEQSFSSFSRSVSSPRSNRNGIPTYNPDWKTRNLVWTLVRSGLGSISPPTAEIERALRALKDAVFSTLFKDNYLWEQRQNCRFRHTLMRHVPQPGAWDADMGFLGAAFFISVPLASTLFSSVSGDELWAFWLVLSIIFIVSSVSIVLIYAKYSSWYCTRLLDSAVGEGEGSENNSFESAHDSFGSSNSGLSFADQAASPVMHDTQGAGTCEVDGEAPASEERDAKRAQHEENGRVTFAHENIMRQKYVAGPVNSLGVDDDELSLPPPPQACFDCIKFL